MNEILQKIELNDDAQTFYATQEFIKEKFGNTGKGIFKIELIEMSGILSPSEVVITITPDSVAGLSLPLWELRNNFYFQNGVFILDASKIDFFTLKLIKDTYFHNTFKINANIEGSKPFKIIMYCSIRQMNSTNSQVAQLIGQNKPTPTL